MTEVAHIPAHHAKRRISSLFPGEIVFTTNEPGNDFDFDQHTPISHDSDTGEMFVFKDALFDPDDLRPKSLLGRAGIMRFVMTPDESDKTLSGIVVDLRRMVIPIPPAEYAANSKPDDSEEQAEWIECMSQREPVLAVASLDDENKLDMNGDPRAFGALEQLIREADLLAKSLHEPETPRRVLPRKPDENEQPPFLERLRQRFLRKKEPVDSI